MKRIQELRNEKRISQVALSMRLNVSQKTVSAYENGKNEPSISVLKQMADIFDTSVDYLIGYSDIRTPLDKISQTNLSENECELLNLYRGLSKEEQYIALGVIMGIKRKTGSEE